MGTLRPAQVECRSIEWSAFRSLEGSSEKLGDGLLALLNATEPETAEAAYWELENHVVAQGTVCEAAIPATSVLIAGLHGEMSTASTIKVLDLLYQILSGHSDETRSDVDADIVSICEQRAREGLWGLIRGYLDEDHRHVRDAYGDVLELIDPDRWSMFRDA